LLGRLAGVPYEGPDGSVVFRTTNVDSIARGAAENWSGADLAITADILKGDLGITKAILAQAKLGGLEDLRVAESSRLVTQIHKMREFTRSPKVLLVPELEGQREPQVASGVRIAAGVPTEHLPLADYFVRRILTTFDGDTRPGFISAVQESSLKQLRMFARIRSNA
jgi:hypothetical protein